MKKTIHEAGENYLEAILELEESGEAVRSIDIATKLAVSRPSVSKAIGILKQAGMIEQQPYGAISLTVAGRKRACEVTHRHRLLKRFLEEVLKVDPKTAETDACLMEHDISDQTMTKLATYLEQTLK